MISPSVSYAVDDLQAPVEILVDRWGVFHVYASTGGSVTNPGIALDARKLIDETC
jgi:acyl-homoserine lactone acylase PvdQ